MVIAPICRAWYSPRSGETVPGSIRCEWCVGCALCCRSPNRPLRTSGILLARSGTSDVVDAAVIVAAIEHNAAVLTSDPKDLAKLASAAEYPVRLLTV